MSNTPSNPAATNIKKCQANAHAYLVGLIGGRAELLWDSTHCLQGHVRLGRHEIVVIATRDASHHPVVLTAPNWEAVRRSQSNERRELIKSCEITDHSGLVSILQSDMDVALAA
jgi:hypothetical protein